VRRVAIPRGTGLDDISPHNTNQLNNPDITANRRRIVRAANPDSPSAKRTTRPSARPRRCAAMNSNTSAEVTAEGSLSITAKNARRSDTVAITVFGRHLPATNST
jgi:hypothetical protein